MEFTVENTLPAKSGFSESVMPGNASPLRMRISKVPFDSLMIAALSTVVTAPPSVAENTMDPSVPSGRWPKPKELVLAKVSPSRPGMASPSRARMR